MDQSITVDPPAYKCYQMIQIIKMGNESMIYFNYRTDNQKYYILPYFNILI